jgi:hypothetical protein
MATNHSRRLDRLEGVHVPENCPECWHRVIGKSEAELDEQVAENVKINATMLHERLSALPTEAALFFGRYPSLNHRTFNDMPLNPLAMWASKRSQVLAPHTRLNRRQPHRRTATGALRPLILFV